LIHGVLDRKTFKLSNWIHGAIDRKVLN